VSAKNAKRARRLERHAAEISKQAERDEREFEALVRSTRARIAAELSEPVIRHDTRRRNLAIAWLLIIAVIAAVFLAGAR
jgi:hypothetical protein